METIFWIIVILAIAAVAVFFIREKMQEAAHHRSFREKFPALNPSPQEPSAQAPGANEITPLPPLDQDVADDLPPLTAEEPIIATTNTLQREATSEPVASPKPDSKVIVLHIMPHKQLRFAGGEILQTMQACGLALGPQKIFHYPKQLGVDGAPLFSIANVMEPGYFDPEGMEDQKYNGLVMFMQLTNSLAALTSFDIMLDKAIRIAKALEGELQDDRRCKLSKQTLGHMRNELEEFQRKAQLEAARKRA